VGAAGTVAARGHEAGSFRVDDDAEMIHVFAITWIG
jgi:hypothetical protein